MSLSCRFWGTRGSIASPGPHTLRYGGNTPCVEVRWDGPVIAGVERLVILDAGTGIRSLGRALAERAKANGTAIDIDLYISHGHWDHIQGIPFFAPLYEGATTVRMRAWDGLEMGLEEVIRNQMAPVVFPVPFDRLPARVSFGGLDIGQEYGDGYTLSAIPVQHPGGALGFRLAERGAIGRSLVYISDNELAPCQQYALGDGWRARLVEWARGAKVMVHDATYIGEEYDAHRGWGHSTCEQAVELAMECEVEQLLLFHHQPERSDDEVDQMIERCQQLVTERGGKVSISAAAEGMELKI